MEDPKVDLKLAVASGNDNAVEWILKKHPELVNCEYHEELGYPATPLLLACDVPYHYPEVAEMLLNFGADSNCEGYCEGYEFYYNEGYSRDDTVCPLMISVKMDHLPLTERLLQAGADVNKTNTIGQTCLHGLFSTSMHKGDRSVQNVSMLKLLLNHNANVNLRDDIGRTPLHYACENAIMEVVEPLIVAAADGYVIDNYGFSELHVAAHSLLDADLKVKRLMEAFSYPVKVVIEVHETLASTLTRSRFPQVDSPSLHLAFDHMRRATLLREEHKLPKSVSSPLECYKFAKEWETLDELSLHKDSLESLTVQAILALERNYKEKHINLYSLMMNSYSDAHSMNRKHLNALLVRHLDFFSTRNDAPKFREMFCEWFERMSSEFEAFETDSVSRVISIAMQSCLKMQMMLDEESKIIPSRKLVMILIDFLLITTGLIMKLFKRNNYIKDSHKKEKGMAEEMLQDLFKNIPEVVSEPINFRKPIQHVIIRRLLTFRGGEIEFKDHDIVSLLMTVLNDLDVTDDGGNTLLHVVAETMDDHFNYSGVVEPWLLKTLNFIIEEGAYLYAKNNNGKTVFDYLAPVMDGDTEAFRTLEKWQSKIPPLQSLAAMKAKDLTLSPDFPERLKKFLALH